jgi:hypothetical protein
LSRSHGRSGNPFRRRWFPAARPLAAARPGRRLPGAVLALWAVLALGAAPSLADPDYGRPILPGLDPLLKSTAEPRLLGAERLILRERLLRQGVDPLREPGRRPDMASLVRLKWHERGNIDLERRTELREYNGPLGILTEITHPDFFILAPLAEPLPGGFTWYPPRPLGDPSVDVFVDDIDRFLARRHAVGAVLTRTDALDRSGSGKNAQETSLINLTIPVKLPRTLEKIIGKGEKTRIKITGREHIALSGESTVTKPFVASERVSSQSLFPTLDMEQQLQINLSGTIGEKIILEVDHNSEQLGPEATKIKLMYRGLEDEIIKTIETGDVGLTLPGSQLLGYSSNKTGLFGLKVTGQVGRADFTVVASKQKAESSSKSFNAKGGQVSDNIIKLVGLPQQPVLQARPAGARAVRAADSGREDRSQLDQGVPADADRAVRGRRHPERGRVRRHPRVLCLGRQGLQQRPLHGCALAQDHEFRPDGGHERKPRRPRHALFL